MMLANPFNHPSRVLAACVVLGLAGCASNQALDNQLASSREALDQAQIAGAEQVASADYNLAAGKLNRATDEATNGNKDDAMRLAQQAQADANLAHARTDSTQARIAAVELQKSNLALRDALIRARQNQQR
jgi:hypothetical protein